MATALQRVDAAGFRLLFAPARTYGALLAGATGSPWWGIARRILLICVVIGTTVALAATASVRVDVVLPMMFWWSIAPVIQLLAAAALVLSVRDRPVASARGIELMLAGHVPWSLWLLGIAPIILLDARRGIFVGSVLLAVAWRAVLLYHFCRTILACSRAASLARTALHQSAIVALIVTYVCWGIAFFARTG